MQGTRIWFLVQRAKIPHHRATKPTCCNYWNPCTLRAHAAMGSREEKPPLQEAHALWLESSSCLLQLEKAHAQQQRTGEAKTKYTHTHTHTNIYIYIYIERERERERERHLFPTTLTPRCNPHDLQSRCSRGSSSQCKISWVRNPMWGSNHSLGRTCEVIIILLLSIAQLEVWILTVQPLCASYPSHCGSFLTSLVVDIYFC